MDKARLKALMLARTFGIVDGKFNNDKEIVIEAIRKNNWAIKDASDELKDDIEVVWESCRYGRLGFIYASNRLFNMFYRYNKENGTTIGIDLYEYLELGYTLDEIDINKEASRYTLHNIRRLKNSENK